MKMAIVIQKEKGRSIAFSSNRKLVVARKKRNKLVISSYNPNFNLSQYVDNKKASIKIFPFSKVILGTFIQNHYAIQSINSSNKLSPATFNIKKLKQQQIINEPISVIVKFGQNVAKSISRTSFPLMTFNVEDIRPVSSILTNGGNIEEMSFAMQQQSFYEIKLKFSAGTIAEVKNLPLGLVLEKGSIKGAPFYSGLIVSEILLNNGDKTSISFDISKLPRKL